MTSTKATSNAKKLAQGILHIPVEESLGKYLGCPTLSAPNESILFSPIMEKANQKKLESQVIVQGWQNN